MKKRILCLLLMLAMLCSLAVLFASCGKEDGYVKLKGDIDVNVSGWSVVYVDSAAKTRTYRNAMTSLASTLSQITGEGVSARLSGAAALSADDPVILIGDTGEMETTKLKKSISGDGFAIRVYDNRIAIVGSSDLMTLYAVNYFTQKLLEGQSSGTVLTLPEEAVAEKLPMVTLATPESTELTMVYKDGLYTLKQHPVDLLVGVYKECDLRDTPVAVTDAVTEALAGATGLGKKKFKIRTDKKDAEGIEFLVGTTNRLATAECQKSLEADEYGFFIKDGQCVLTGWGDAGLLAAQSDFSDLLKEAGAIGKDSKITVAFPEGFFYVGNLNKNWKLDIPYPDGVELYSTMDTADDSVQLVYKGEGVSAAAFTAYVTKLKGEGYTVINENSIEDSLFATLVKESAKSMLYVSYNAFKHEGEYDHSYDPLMRVVSYPTTSVSVPNASVLSKQPYTKLCNSAVTAVEMGAGAVGMCYIVTLEDGSFIVFDGGMNASNEAGALWNLLETRYRQTHNGKDPTDSDPIHVAAWVVTHSHADHYGVFRNFLSNYGKKSNFKMSYLIGNFPSASAVNCVYDSDIGAMGAPGAIKSLQDITNFTFLKVQSGQKYYFANLEIEVLMTYDDHAPNQIKNQNDTCTVLRFSMQATKNGIDENGGVTNVGDPYVMIWLGDANNQQSRYLCAMYGKYLESEMVQLAHHGNIGCESDLYDTIKAEAVWFPHNLDGYRSYLYDGAEKSSSWVVRTDWKIVNGNPYTKYVYVSGTADRQGWNTTLPFGDDGRPAYEDIFNTLQGEDAKIEYIKNTVFGGIAIKPPQNWN